MFRTMETFLTVASILGVISIVVTSVGLITLGVLEYWK